jgi:hypothetical protein
MKAHGASQQADQQYDPITHDKTSIFHHANQDDKESDALLFLKDGHQLTAGIHIGRALVRGQTQPGVMLIFHLYSAVDIEARCPS